MKGAHSSVVAQPTSNLAAMSVLKQILKACPVMLPAGSAHCCTMLGSWLVVARSLPSPRRGHRCARFLSEFLDNPTRRIAPAQQGGYHKVQGSLALVLPEGASPPEAPFEGAPGKSPRTVGTL